MERPGRGWKLGMLILKWSCYTAESLCRSVSRVVMGASIMVWVRIQGISEMAELRQSRAMLLNGSTLSQTFPHVLPSHLTLTQNLLHSVFPQFWWRIIKIWRINSLSLSLSPNLLPSLLSISGIFCIFGYWRQAILICDWKLWICEQPLSLTHTHIHVMGEGWSQCLWSGVCSGDRR